jgi:hypothetical protein
MGICRVESYDRVSQDDKIGTAAGVIDRVCGPEISAVKVGCGGRSKMTARREAHPSDPIRRDIELFGQAATNRIARCASSSMG